MKDTRRRVPPEAVRARREKILTMAKANKTTVQISRELNMPIRHIHTDIWRMRKQGVDVPLRLATGGWGAYQRNRRAK